MSYTSYNGQRRSYRISTMKHTDFSKFSDFEKYVSDIVDKKISFNPINETIESTLTHTYPTREGSHIDYSKFFDSDDINDFSNDDDWVPYQQNTSHFNQSKYVLSSHYNLRPRK